MNVLITGIRTFWSEELIAAAVAQSGYKITKVISGLGAGVEYGAIRWANAHNVRTVGFDIFPYKGDKNPEEARLKDMVSYCQAVIFITDGKGKKSQKALQLAKASGIPIFTMQFKKEVWHGGSKRNSGQTGNGHRQGVQEV